MSNMAPFKQPCTLFNISANMTACLINEACETLAKKYVTWDSAECKNDIKCFQQYLVSNLPGPLLDEIYNKHSPKTLPYDPRIYIAVFMHEHMKEFQTYPEFVGERNLDSFWTEMLCHSKSIHHLYLHGFCSDVILNVVGENCNNLQYINISSAKRSVTDAGIFHHLEKCINLKFIILGNGQINVTKSGIIRLLKKLPYLEYISHRDIGFAISDIVNETDSLSLRKILLAFDISHIAAISRVCTNLQVLDIYLPSSKNNEVLLSNMCCNSLADSMLQISDITIENVHVTKCLFNFLHVKGKYLENVRLYVDKITGGLIYAFGKYCPNIRNLDLVDYVQSIHTNFEDEDIFADKVHSNEIMFSKLESLKLTVDQLSLWNLNTVLCSVLSHTKQIERIFLLVNKNYDADSMMSKILEKNPLTHLKYFFVTCKFSLNTILYLFRSPHMKHLIVKMHDQNNTSDNIKMLYDEISQNNLDIELIVI